MKENQLIGQFDASIWAKEFVKLVKRKPEIATDEETMLGWFANAIMTGYDSKINRDRKFRPSKAYLIMRMRENLNLKKGLGKTNHTKCLREDIKNSSYSWKEIEELARGEDCSGKIGFILDFFNLTEEDT